MGLNSGSNMIYLSVKAGKLVNVKLKREGYSYTGMLKHIRVKDDEYQGQALKRVELEMTDKEETVCIQFGKESWFSWGFFARAQKIDLNKPLTVGASQSEQMEKISFCWLKQGNETIKKDETFPKPDAVNFGGKVLKDWIKVDLVVDKIIADINDKLDGALKGGTVIDSDLDFPPADLSTPSPSHPYPQKYGRR
jgi:hypothetical protein